MKKTVFRILSLVLSLAVCLGCFAGCAPQQHNQVDYADQNNWAVLELSRTDAAADVFFICPTVYGGTESSFNMPLEDEQAKASFVGATRMEQGIYSGNARFFAPYYRQAGLVAYSSDARQQEDALAFAYEDIQDAFAYYLAHYNQGRPLVLAGFSQGADLCLRLMKDFFDDPALQCQLVACYAIGWRITQEEIDEFPHLKVAQGEADVGVIVSYNTEAEEITDSLMVPAGTKTLAINPLNWKTDATMADKSLNLGACFTDYSGEIINEIPQLTGAYLDPVRGTLKVTDIDMAEYPPSLSLFAPGVYHVYDPHFFYRNLQQNVQTRIEAYLQQER